MANAEETWDNQLLQYSYINLIDGVEFALSKGANVNSFDVDGKTALYYAVMNDNLELVELLLKNGAFTMALDGEPPILYASRDGLCDFLELLFKYNVNIYATDVDEEFIAGKVDTDRGGNTCLHLSVQYGYLKCIEIILKNNYEFIKLKNNVGNTALHIAAYIGEKEICEELLKYPISYPEPRNNSNMTPLCVAITTYPYTNDYEYIKMFISKGSDVNVTCGNDQTLLENLLNEFKSLNYFNNDEIEDMSEEIELFKIVLDRIKDINDRNYLHLACELPYNLSIELCRLLIEKGADVNKKNSLGKTPLHMAVINSDEKCIELLLNSGADIESKDNKGITPLMNAISHGVKNNITILLLEKGANPNSTDTNGKTALFYFGVFDEYTEEMIKILYEFGANIFHKNKKGKIFIEYLTQKTPLFGDDDSEERNIVLTEQEEENFKRVFEELQQNELLKSQQRNSLSKSGNVDSDLLRQIFSSMPLFSSTGQVEDTEFEPQVDDSDFIEDLESSLLDENEPSVETTGGSKRRKTKKNKSSKKKTKRKKSNKKKTKKRKTKRKSTKKQLKNK